MWFKCKLASPRQTADKTDMFKTNCSTSYACYNKCAWKLVSQAWPSFPCSHTQDLLVGLILGEEVNQGQTEINNIWNKTPIPAPIPQNPTPNSAANYEKKKDNPPNYRTGEQPTEYGRILYIHQLPPLVSSHKALYQSTPLLLTWTFWTGHSFFASLNAK